MIGKWGKYRIDRLLATGGMAEVFLAERTGPKGFSKSVCLKCVREEFHNNSEFVNMFETEAKIAATLDHPNIVQVFDFDTHKGRFFLAMEYVDGLDLHNIITAANRLGLRLPLEFTVHVMHGLLAALSYAHGQKVDSMERPVIHRDVSPHNVLVSKGGIVKLTDFGIAKVKGFSEETQIGVVKGKPDYLSPEQAGKKNVEFSSDLYSAGLVLFEMLTGRRFQLGEGIVPEIPSASRELNDTLKTLLKRLPADRFKSAQSALEALFKTGIPVASDFEAGELVKKLLEHRAFWAITASDEKTNSTPPKESKPENDPKTESDDSNFKERTTSSTDDIEMPPDIIGLAPGPTRESPGKTKRYIVIGFLAVLAVSIMFLIIENASFLSEKSNESETEKNQTDDPIKTPASLPPVATLPPSTNATQPDASFDTDSQTDPKESTETLGEGNFTSTQTGHLEINVRPWAEVQIDGVNKGSTPLKKIRLKTGDHRITLTNNELNYKKTIYVKIRPGKTTSINKTIFEGSS